jgi:mono/diheme cytochrome c family protein
VSKTSKVILFAAVATVTNIVCLAQDAGNPANGKIVFVRNGCARCHGTQGQGGAGVRIAPNPPAMAALIRYVRKPTGTMPAYTNQVTDAELTDVRAYLAAVPTPPPVKDIPLLNQ